MDLQFELKIVLDIALVSYSVSFAWMVAERIRGFPRIRRFFAIYMGLELLTRSYIIKKKERERILADLFVLFSAWLIIISSLCLSIAAFLAYASTYTNEGVGTIIYYRYLVPSVMFLSPQFVSRLISSIVLGFGKKEIAYLYEHDREALKVFPTRWKKAYDLDKDGLRTGVLFHKARVRAFTSLMYLVGMYLMIFLICR